MYILNSNDVDDYAGYVYIEYFSGADYSNIYTAYWGNNLEDCLRINDITLDDLY